MSDMIKKKKRKDSVESSSERKSSGGRKQLGIFKDDVVETEVIKEAYADPMEKLLVRR